MANTLKFGNGTWATKKDSILAYNDQNENYKPLPFNYTGAGKGTRVNKEGLIEVVENDRPRIDYTDSEDGVFLLEKAATNLITNSEKFVDAPTGATNMDLFSGTITSNNTTSPNGNVTAMKFTIGGASSSLLRIYQSDLSTTSDNTFSIYAKKGTADSLSIDITDVTVVNSVLTDEWQRISVTDISTASKFIDVEVFGNVGEYIYIFGLQLEQGSYATSYIPTSGSAVTRVLDVCTNGGNNQVINSTEGVLYVEIKRPINQLETSQYLGVSGGSTDNRFIIGASAGSSNLRFIGDMNDVRVLDVTRAGFNKEDWLKIAIVWDLSEFKIFINGTKNYETTLSDNFTPNILNTFEFANGSKSSVFYGISKDVRVYNTALTDAELQALTQ